MDKNGGGRRSSPPQTSGKRVGSNASTGKRGVSAHASAKRKGVKQAIGAAVAAAGDPAPPGPATTPEDLAASFIAMIEQFQAQIPNYQHHDPSDIRRVAAIARFAPDLVVPTITTTTSFAPAAQRNLFDIEANQMVIRRQNAFQPVIQRLTALTDGLQFTVNNDLAEAGSQALDVYSWAKSYAKRPDAAALRPYVAAMSRVVKKVLNHRKTKTPAPAPATTELPPAARTFLAPNLVPAEAAGTVEYPDHFTEALDRATKD
jgi:hypothetical protein